MASQAVTIKIPVIPAVLIILFLSGLVSLKTFGAGPWAQYLPFHEVLWPPTPPAQEISPWRETAFTGVLHQSLDGKSFYLVTASQSEAITLEVPANVELIKLVNRRIFAAGSFNQETNVLKVREAASMEILPQRPTPVPVSPNIATSSAEIISTPSAVPTVSSASASE